MKIKQYLSSLVCPETKQKLMLSSKKETDLINKLIEEGKIKNRGKNLIVDKFQGYLKYNNLYYPVKNGIPILVISESIKITENDL